MRQKGFSLIEIMIVIVIMGVVTSISGATTGNWGDACKKSCTLDNCLLDKSGMTLFGVDVAQATPRFRKGTANTDDAYSSGK
ncbi:prepilin-type N-terminal cleavage/methylation domain-containing protein [uncultured Fibrobacter sp.]|uniref:prepilin-type N-terminal cleavage/methylation domain-containing protein n=1 Tax=uncultured Fibrobacter sp. TaxID=261512 RepID=UPI00345A71C9